MHLDVGPLVRTLRRQPAVLALVVLEIAAGVATISTLLISGSWYGHVAMHQSGLDEARLILFSTYSTGEPAEGEEAEGEKADGEKIERAIRDVQANDRQRVLALEGVEAVAGVTTSVLDERWSFPSLFVSYDAQGARRADHVGWGVFTDEGLVSTMGLRFVAGVAPTSVETAGMGPPVTVLTRALAERLFATSASAIARTVTSEQYGAVTVVGVVEDVLMRMPFLPRGESVAFVFGNAPFDHEVRLLVRAAPGRRDDVLERLRAAFAPDATRRFVETRAFDSAESLHHRVGGGLLRLLGFFGLLLGLVVLLGALAATSFLVAQRTRQIGIRRALGATKADIVGYFLVESLLATTLGSLLGVAGSIVLYRMMKPLFPQISFDLRLLSAALGVLWLASILATLIPALRAARIPPSVASRSL